MRNRVFTRSFGFALTCVTVILAGFSSQSAVAETAAQVHSKVDIALEVLYQKTPTA